MAHRQPRGSVRGDSPISPVSPGRWTRTLFRVPTLVYRLRGGWLLGHRFLMLTHVGRTTGHLHTVVLEVLHFDPVSREAVVMSGFGRRSNWYRNLQAAPARRVVVGRDSFVPEHRELSEAEAVAVLHGNERHHPLIRRLIRRVLSSLVGWSYDGSAAARRRLVRELPLLAFRPRDDRHHVVVDHGQQQGDDQHEP